MKKREIKGLIPAVIIWFLCALYSVSTVVNRFMAIGESYESTPDCVIEGVHYIIYLVAFVLGLIYLFKNDRKFAVSASIVYVVARLYTLLSELISGYYSAEGIIILVIQLVAFALSAIITSNLVKGKEAKAYNTCVKFWYIPSVVLLLTGLIESIITEINDTHGFDLSLVFVDVTATIILLLPMYIMTVVVKNDVKNSITE